MDFYKNVDKLSDIFTGVSYNQITDVQREAVVTEPVSLSELKEFAKVSGSTDDAILTALISAAREICELYIGQSLVQREITAWFNNYNGGTYLPYGPIGTITGFFNHEDEAIDCEVQGTQFKQVLSPFMPLKAIYQGGYADCPENFKTAIKCQALYLFENRGDSQEAMSPIAVQILQPFKRV
jgi:hypothetical protein